MNYQFMITLLRIIRVGESSFESGWIFTRNIGNEIYIRTERLKNTFAKDVGSFLSFIIDLFSLSFDSWFSEYFKIEVFHEGELYENR